MKRFFDHISSRRFAVQLLLVTTIVILLSNLVPKPYILTETELAAMKRERPLLFYFAQHYNVEKITKSPVFVAIVLFIFISITVCTARRVKKRLDAPHLRFPDIRTIPATHSISVPDSNRLSEAFGAILARRRWKYAEREEAGERVFFAHKGSEGLWGSAAFHVGMCIVLTGALLSAMTRYNGRLVITEDFDLEPSRVLKGLSDEQRRVFPIRGMALESFEPVYSGAFPVDYTADIVNEDIYGRVYKQAIRVNEPMRAGSYTFLLGRYGFAPRFALMDSSGKTISDDIVNLSVITPDKVDRFKLLNGTVTVSVNFFPDFYIDTGKGRPSTRSRYPNRPVFLATLERFGKEQTGGFLPLGGAIEFGGYTLEFKELRYWIQLDVSRDSGVPMIAVGFFFIVFGLVLRLLLNEKSIWIIIKGNNVGIGGKARFFPALFEEETGRIAEEIRQKSGAGSQESEGQGGKGRRG